MPRVANYIGCVPCIWAGAKYTGGILWLHIVSEESIKFKVHNTSKMVNQINKWRILQGINMT